MSKRGYQSCIAAVLKNEAGKVEHESFCPICHNTLEETISSYGFGMKSVRQGSKVSKWTILGCGHHVCFPCFAQLFQGDHDPQCPLCRELIFYGVQISQIYPYSVNKMIYDFIHACQLQTWCRTHTVCEMVGLPCAFKHESFNNHSARYLSFAVSVPWLFGEELTYEISHEDRYDFITFCTADDFAETFEGVEEEDGIYDIPADDVIIIHNHPEPFSPEEIEAIMEIIFS